MAGKRAPAARSAVGSPRLPGRPVAASPELRPHLLDAALACYARGGIAATSLRAIAREAGVTPALLHYYFGSGDRLLEAVVEERIAPAIEGLRAALPLDGNDVAALVAGFVRGIGAIVARHPWLPALWVREVLCDGGALRDFLRQRIGPQIPALLAQRFAEAQQRGALNPDLDPRLLVVSLVGLTLFPAASAPVWRGLFGADDIDAGVLRAHTIALLDRGLRLV